MNLLETKHLAYILLANSHNISIVVTTFAHFKEEEIYIQQT